MTKALKIAALGMLGAMASADDALAGDSVCDRTADTIAQSCRSESSEEYFETVANCKYVGDRDDRLLCFDLARAERDEAREACAEERDARQDACETLGENRYDPDPLLDPAIQFVDVEAIGDTVPVGPYFSLAPGHTYVLRAGEEEEELVVVHVTDETREIEGVECRVVADVVFEQIIEDDGDDKGVAELEIVEYTDDYYAQDVDGNVYYCGEVSRNYEDGYLDNLDGSFVAGEEFAKSGVLVLAMPVPGLAHRQEVLFGEAEDIVQYVSLAADVGAGEGGDNPNFPCDGACLKTFEFTPLEPDGGEFKYYREGIGFVLAVALEDGEPAGEREVLVCVGDSLDLLDDPACAIDDPDELRDDLCEVAPDFFCDDDSDE